MIFGRINNKQYQGWPNGGSSDPCWRLFKPFKKLKNYMGVRRMFSCDDLFFCRKHHDFDTRIEYMRSIRDKDFFFRENYKFGTKSGKSEDDFK